MTPPARNSSSPATAGSSILAALVGGHVEAARAFGLPADTLLAQAGLDPAALQDPDGRVPLERWIALWEAIAAAPASADFGFWLGENVTVRALGVVGFAMQHAADVRGAFACLERFRRLINDVISPDIVEQSDRIVFRRTEPPRIARLAPLAVAAPVGTMTLLRELTGVSDASTAPIEAAFQHPPPPNAHRYQEVLGCPVHFNADELRLVLPRALFDRPLRRADPQLFAYLQRHADALLGRTIERDTAAALVRQALCERLREGEPRQGDVARTLALSERTLQRRLTEEGTSFAAILDDVRAQLSRMYLEDPHLAVFEVAYLVGYSEPSAFVRAFRRWTGTNPREYRQRRSETGGAQLQ